MHALFLSFQLTVFRRIKAFALVVVLLPALLMVLLVALLGASALVPSLLRGQATIRWELQSSFPTTHIPYTVFAASNGLDVFAGTNRGVLRSSDNGLTWNASTGGIPPTTQVRGFVQAGTIIFAGTSQGVFRTTSNGQVWTTIGGTFNGLENPNVQAIALFRRELFAATPSGVFRSQDNGLSWLNISSGLSQTFPSTFLAARLLQDSALYLGTDRGGLCSKTMFSMPPLLAMACFHLRLESSGHEEISGFRATSPQDFCVFRTNSA
jgi:ligand-binding sensor domain-containing protein